MTILRSLLSKIVTQRLPQSLSGWSMPMYGGQLPQGKIAQMEAYGNVGWLFGVVSRICESVAGVEWHLYNKASPGADRKELFSHPFLDLWNDINDFYTLSSFLEACQQHKELTGEMWWLIVSAANGKPLELWPIRPDRIRPVPSTEAFIAGYIYQIGSEKIPLELDDVIYSFKPNPLDPYRGLGPVQALLTDIQSEHAAAQWTGSFFRNDATPGGVIEVDEKMDPRDFDALVDHWRQTHQGTGNAQRVSILEGAHWKDVKYTQRDMQFTQLRMLNRDLILGAFGFPTAVLGIAENVNRANAEAAEVLFARWLVRPRLDAIKSMVNELLLPRYGGNIEVDYLDPTPSNNEFNLNLANIGYAGGWLKRNEARTLMAFDPDPTPDGDMYKPVTAPVNTPSIPTEPVSVPIKALESLMLKAADDEPLLTKPEAKAEARMHRNWTKRLKAEAEGLIAHLEDKLVKVEATDLEDYSWDWWEKYGDDVIDELVTIFEIAMITAEPTLPLPIMQVRAATYARARAGELLGGDSSLSLVAFTRLRVGELVAETIEQGLSLRQLQQSLESHFAFSPERATMIARTETATALGQGAREASLAQGRDEKMWLGQSPCDLCAPNEGDGWIPINDSFSSGDDTIPLHPNCRCNVIYRTSPVSNVDPFEAAFIPEARCPDCAKLLGKNVRAATLYCDRCKREVAFSGEKIVAPVPVLALPAPKKTTRRLVEYNEAGLPVAVTTEEY